MSGPEHLSDERYRAHVLRPARIILTVCQMILGAGLAVTLILKVYMLVLTDHQCVADAATIGNGIRCSPTLEIMAYGLALSAGFELAYLLFEGGMDRAVRPLVLGLGSGFLLLVSGLAPGAADWQAALTLTAVSASFFAGLVALKWLRDKG